MKRLITKPLILFCSIFATNLLYAEASVSANANSLTISSDHIKQDKSWIVYDGSVIITQGSLVIQADKAVIKKNNIRLNKVIATGHPATFEQKFAENSQVNGTAKTLQYDPKHNNILLDGDASIIQNSKTFQNKNIIYDLNTHSYK